MYQPLKLDPGSGNYPTTNQLDPAAVSVFNTSADPHRYPVVLLVAESNIRPSVFEFEMRSALAQLGIKRVYLVSEFAQLSADNNLPFASRTDPLPAAQAFADKIAPVLVVTMDYEFIGNATVVSNLSVVDARERRSLFVLNQPKKVWSNWDAEALWPVLNELRRWVKASTKGVT